MRRFDGVNLNKKKTERRHESPLILPKFDEIIEPFNKSIKKNTHINIGNSHFINLKNIAAVVVWIIIITTVIFLGNQAKKTKQSILSLQDSMERDLEMVQTYAGNGNVEGSLDQLDKLQGSIIKSKLIAESWGQDVGFFQYVPGHKSSLTQKEIILTTGYDVINLSRELQKDASSLQENNISLSDSKTFSIDLSLIGNKVERIIKKINKRVARHRRLLLGMDSDQAEKITSNLDQLSLQASNMDVFIKKDLPWLSGGDGKEKNILLIFQNNGELRGGSGGSLGSFGIVKFKDGSLEKIDFGTNIYKLDNEFVKKEAVVSPDELLPFNNGHWSMKQSGFAVDGREALDKIMWFYNKETGQSVDGAITIDTTAFVSLLKLVGPIEMTEYGKTLDAENFVKETQLEVQVDYFDRTGGIIENEPKKILGDMIPKFTEKLFKGLGDKNKSIQILASFAKSLENKNILFNFENVEFQTRLDNQNYSGLVRPVTGDYLYVNASNVGGAKTNQLTLSNLNLSVDIAADGQINDKLIVERTHTGDGVFPDGRAQDFMRVLIPQKSEVKNFTPTQGNFQIWHDMGYYKDGKHYVREEAGKNSVGFWMSLEPGQKGIAEIEYIPVYKLDVSQDFVYSILIQHQPGAPVDNVNLDISYPEGFSPTNVRNFDSQARKINLKLNLSKDKVIKIKFKKLNKLSNAKD